MKNYDSAMDTIVHKQQVSKFIGKVINELYKRAIFHDDTKLYSHEKETFDEYTPKLKDSTYGSDEYKTFLAEMKPALDHHYLHNRHHPEYFNNDMSKMNLVDLLEMISDWQAATLRHDDGDIMKSIEINQKRFGYSDELKGILQSTVIDLF